MGNNLLLIVNPAAPGKTPCHAEFRLPVGIDAGKNGFEILHGYLLMDS